MARVDPVKRAEYNRLWRLKNHEQIKAKERVYRAENREHLRAYHKTVAMRLRAFGLRHKGPIRDVAAMFWERAIAAGLVRCALTGDVLTPANASPDHEIPRAAGGSDGLANLRWTRADVNIARQDMPDAEFVNMCRKVAANG